MRKKKREECNRDAKVEDLSRLQALLTEDLVLCDIPALADRDSILKTDKRHLFCELISKPATAKGYPWEDIWRILMRRAFELAFSTTYAFAGVAPPFVEVDLVGFLRPVSTHPAYDVSSSI